MVNNERLIFVTESLHFRLPKSVHCKFCCGMHPICLYFLDNNLFPNCLKIQFSIRGRVEMSLLHLVTIGRSRHLHILKKLQFLLI